MAMACPVAHWAAAACLAAHQAAVCPDNFGGTLGDDGAAEASNEAGGGKRTT